MTRCRLAVLCLLVVTCAVGAQETPKVSPYSPGEPTAGKLSLARSAAYLDKVALKWTSERKCGSCHTNYPYLMARPLLKDVPGKTMIDVRSFFEQRAAHWDDPKGKPRWDTEVVATAVALAVNDAYTTGRLHPLTRQSLDRMWTLQQPHGAWSWLKCDWPPMEHDDYFGATYAALGVGAAPDDYARTGAAVKGLAKLRGYFAKNAPPDLHHQAMLLWASVKLDGLLSPSDREATIKRLLAAQREDGGWSLPALGNYKRREKDDKGAPIMNDKNAPSDGYGTGFVVYVLRQAGVPADHAQIRRGADWLRANQLASGRWFTRSLNNDSHHFIGHAGTAYAVMALRSCGQQ